MKTISTIKTLVQISWRNMWRQKRRSLVVITSMSIGIFAMIVSIAFMNGMVIQMVDNTINTTLGHIAIHRAGYQDSMRLSLNFFPEDRVYRSLKKDAEITSFTPRVKVKGMVRSSEGSRGVMVVGIDPEREKNVSKIYDYTIKKGGSRFLEDPESNDALISKSLADKLDLYLGDRFVLMIADKNKDISGVGLTVAGFFESPVDSFDNFFMFIGIGRLQAITGLGGNISEITILTKDKDEVDEVKQRLISAIGAKDREILSWKDMAPVLVSYIGLQDQLMFIFFLIIFITVIFSVANTLIMSIMERFHELGVMKSLGTRPSYIFFLVVFEAVNLGLMGLLAGIIIGIPIVLVFSQTGIDLSFAMDVMRKWKIGAVIYPVLMLKDIISASIIIFITTILAAIYPAYKAARIKPFEALHYL